MNLGIVSLSALVAEICVSLQLRAARAPRPATPIILHGVWPHRLTGRIYGLVGPSVPLGSFPKSVRQGRAVKGAVVFLEKLPLFNLLGKIFALLAESLPEAYNHHHNELPYVRHGKTLTYFI